LWLRTSNSAPDFVEILTNTVQAELTLKGFPQVATLADYGVAVTVVDTRAGVWQLTNEINTLATIVRPTALSGDRTSFRLLLATNGNFKTFEIETANTYTFDWRQETNFVTSPSNGTLILTFPVSTNQLYRVRPL
jgi:hypothetical protein